MLQVTNVWKSFAGRAVVSDVSFSAARGQIVGLLGPNGAGKSTTASIDCGLTAPDRGEVRIDGQKIDGDVSPAKMKIGLVPQDIALYEGLSALGNLEVFGALYGLKGSDLQARAADALSLVGLSDRAKDKPSTFSGGMKRRLNIACALVHDPDILILDEPTVGVDPQSRNAIFDNLESLKARGKAMVYTTHYMEEAERLCDQIVIIDHGKVIANDTLAGLYRQLPISASLDIELDRPVDLAALQKVSGVVTATQALQQTAATLDGQVSIGLDSLTSSSASVITWLAAQGHQIRSIRSGRASLEQLFLSLTGRQLRD